MNDGRSKSSTSQLETKTMLNNFLWQDTTTSYKRTKTNSNFCAAEGFPYLR